MDEFKYNSEESYPQIRVCRGCNNSKDLRLLQRVYAGANGEITAIMQYIHNSLTFNDSHKEISEILEKIAIVEMKHLYMLGEAIIALGGKAKYINIENNTYWNTGIINYGNNLCKQLMKNLRSETDAYKTYLKYSDLATNTSLRMLFARIALDERLHIDIFKSLIEKYCQS